MLATVSTIGRGQKSFTGFANFFHRDVFKWEPRRKGERGGKLKIERAGPILFHILEVCVSGFSFSPPWLLSPPYPHVLL